jgi:hypothetical protein
MTPQKQLAPTSPTLTLDPNQFLSTLSQLSQISQPPELPRAPVNEEHQKAFWMGLGQSVWQTITQNLTQTPSVNTGSALGNILSSPAVTPASRIMEMPATDPKWQCPPLPERPVRTRLPQTRPLSVPSLGKRRAPFTPGFARPPKAQRVSQGPSPLSTRSSEHIRAEERQEPDPENDDVAIEAYPSPQTANADQEFHLSDEDVQYIKAQEKVEQLTFEQIKSSRAEWKDWPLSVFRQHYFKHGKSSFVVDMENPTAKKIRALPRERRSPAQEATAETHKPPPPAAHPRSPAKPSRRSRRRKAHDAHLSDTQSPFNRDLPTPNSLSNSEHCPSSRDHGQVTSTEDKDDSPLCQSHQEISEMRVSPENEQVTSISRETLGENEFQEETVLPSIEAVESEEDELREPQPPVRYQRVEVRIPRVAMPFRPTISGGTPQATAVSSPLKCDIPTAASPSPESESDIHLVPEPPVEMEIPAPRPPTDGEKVDELAEPLTPPVKREPLSPEPSSLFMIPRLSTPKSAPQLGRLHSSGAKSTPRLSKSHIRKLARAQWAKNRNNATPLRAKHRGGLREALPIRGEPDESEDELAM